MADLSPEQRADLRRRAAQQASTGNYWAGKVVGLSDRIQALEAQRDELDAAHSEAIARLASPGETEETRP